MAYYRLYCINEQGRFVRFDDFEAVDDAAAFERVRQLNNFQATELWCGRRKVRSFGPPSSGLGSLSLAC